MTVQLLLFFFPLLPWPLSISICIWNYVRFLIIFLFMLIWSGYASMMIIYLLLCFCIFLLFFFHFYSLWLQNLKVKSWQIAFSDIIFFILILKVQKDVPHWALVWHSRCSFSVSSCWKHLVFSAAELKHKPQTPWQTLRSWQQLLVNESSSWAS